MGKKRLWTVDLCDWPYRYTGPESTRVNTGGLCDLAAEFRVSVELVPSGDVPSVRSRGIGVVTHLPELGDVPAYRLGLCNDDADVQSKVFPAYGKAISFAAPGEKVLVFTGVVAKAQQHPGDKDRLIKHLKMLGAEAAARGVILVLEHLNDKGSHPDDMRGHTDYRGSDLNWMAEVVRAVNMKSVRLLFDVYHVELMHTGKMPQLLRECFDIIGHVHLAGVVANGPSRVELDAPGQQIPFLEVASQLTALGYDKGVGLEYMLNNDRPVAEGIAGSLRAIGIAA